MTGKVMIPAALMAAWLSSACAPMYFAPAAPPDPHRQRIARLQAPVGRWDAVMSLRPGSLIRVLHADGSVQVGRFAHAGFDALRLHASGTVVDVGIDEVMRVEAPNDGASRARRILASAAAYSLALAANVMFLGAIFGGGWDVPPVRTWALGGALGAAIGIVDSALSGRWRTIYLSPVAATRTF